MPGVSFRASIDGLECAVVVPLVAQLPQRRFGGYFASVLTGQTWG